MSHSLGWWARVSSYGLCSRPPRWLSRQCLPLFFLLPSCMNCVPFRCIHSRHSWRYNAQQLARKQSRHCRKYALVGSDKGLRVPVSSMWVCELFPVLRAPHRLPALAVSNSENPPVWINLTNWLMSIFVSSAMHQRPLTRAKPCNATSLPGSKERRRHLLCTPTGLLGH